MSKRANRKPAASGRKGRIQIAGSDGVLRNTTTWPLAKADPKTGVQPSVPGIRVNW